MAHYAYLDKNNIVTQVIVGRDEDDPLPENVLSWEEYYGAIRCSYNTYGGVHKKGGDPFRKNFPSIGYSYDTKRDAFVPPKPYESWVLNEETCLWESPKPYPDDGGYYSWVEATLSWEPTLELIARAWRDDQLKATDWIASVFDHPQHAAYMAYRQALRDWPSTDAFPDTRPELGA